MVVTVLDSHLEEDQVAALQSAYAAAVASGKRPPGLVRSELLRDARDPTHWRIQTWWESRQALEAMRNAGGTPAGVLMFRAAGAEPALTVFEVADDLPLAASQDF